MNTINELKKLYKNQPERFFGYLLKFLFMLLVILIFIVTDFVKDIYTKYALSFLSYVLFSFIMIFFPPQMFRKRAVLSIKKYLADNVVAFEYVFFAQATLFLYRSNFTKLPDIINLALRVTTTALFFLGLSSVTIAEKHPGGKLVLKIITFIFFIFSFAIILATSVK